MVPETRTSTCPSGSSLSSKIERSAARYLFAVSILSNSSRTRVTTGELQEQLDVAPSSVTEMISKLDDRGLVDYEKYQGVRLTDRGAAIAERIGRRFCVVSTFFESELDTMLDDRTAFDIGYALPEDGVFGLHDLVGSRCLGMCPEADGSDDECVA